jgi:hypothetical protein
MIRPIGCRQDRDFGVKPYSSKKVSVAAAVGLCPAAQTGGILIVSCYHRTPTTDGDAVIKARNPHVGPPRKSAETSLRFYPVVFASLLFLCSCSSKPLTESECRSLAEKEIDFAVSKLPPREAESMRNFFSTKVDEGTKRCLSGKTYDRRDYQCMV